LHVPAAEKKVNCPVGKKGGVCVVNNTIKKGGSESRGTSREGVQKNCPPGRCLIMDLTKRVKGTEMGGGAERKGNGGGSNC